MLTICLITFICSLVGSMLVIRYSYLGNNLLSDPPHSGVQKFHTGFVPRVGGGPLLIASSLGIYLAITKGAISWQLGGYLLISALPIFAAGLLEDLTQRIAPRWRLLASFVSAAFAIWLFKVYLHRVAVPGLDYLLVAFPFLAVAFTVAAVGGICHAMNIIDGYNGLSGGVSGMILLALAYVAWKIGDQHILMVCLVICAAIGGFMVWNFPRGLIFAGDGGAYLLGFLTAQLSVLLVVRNPDVSPWFPLTLTLYPVWETIFSMYRKRMLRGQSPGIPDSLHFHMLIYQRLTRWMVGSKEARHMLQRNSLTSPYLWGMGLLTIMPALLFWRNTIVLQIICVLFIVIYVWLYRRLVSFRAPKWLILYRSHDVLPRQRR